MIPPHGLEVTFDKTCHVIFPAAIAYVDLGSANIIAGKADGAENVIRVKVPLGCPCVQCRAIRHTRHRQTPTKYAAEKTGCRQPPLGPKGRLPKQEHLPRLYALLPIQGQESEVCE